MLTAVTLFFDIFNYSVCLFCSHIVVNIIEFDANVIQVRGLATLKPDLIHHSLLKKMPVHFRNMPAIFHSFDVYAI